MKFHIRLPTLILLIIYLTIPATALLAYTTRNPIPQLPVQIPQPEFNGTNAYQLLVNLTREYPKRVVGTAQGNESAYWMASYFQKLGLKTENQTFPTADFSRQRVSGANVYAISPGSSDRAIILLAHRDVHPRTSEGADDNGSGTVALMELARSLTGTPHNLTYYFLSTDSEEVNLGGSRFFVEHVARFLNVTLALSMDVIGYKEEHSLLIYAYNHESKYADAGTLLTASSIGQRLGLPTYPQVSDQMARRAGIRLFGSDSESFIAQGIQSYSIADPSYPYAHTASDSIDQISASRLEMVGRWVETLVYNLDQGLTMPALGGTYLIYADGYTPSIGILLHLAVYPLVAIAAPAWLLVSRSSKKSQLLKAGRPVLASFLVLLAAILLPVVYQITGLWPPPIPQLRLPLVAIYLGELLTVTALLLLAPTKLFKALRTPIEPVEPRDARIWIVGLLSITFLLTFALHPYTAILFFALPALLPQTTSARRRGGPSLSLLIALLAPFPLYAAALGGTLIFGFQGALESLVDQISRALILFELAAVLAIAIATGYNIRESLSRS